MSAAITEKIRGIDHYENFPVASVLLPSHLRYPIQTIYRFARSADDIADEGNAPATDRLRDLDAYREQLALIDAKLRPTAPLFVSLADVIAEFKLPLQLFHDLLDAFSQDVTKNRYADFDELMDYCLRSANPIGRLLLHLFHADDPQRMEWSDRICSSLQLINFLQDVAIDFEKGRIYLPMNELSEFGISEKAISQADTTGKWSSMMGFQIERASQLLESGAPLGQALPGRLGLEIRMIVAGGRRILHKLRQAQGDVFRRRPLLKSWDWAVMFLGSALPSSRTQ